MPHRIRAQSRASDGLLKTLATLCSHHEWRIPRLTQRRTAETNQTTIRFLLPLSFVWNIIADGIGYARAISFHPAFYLSWLPLRIEASSTSPGMMNPYCLSSCDFPTSFSISLPPDLGLVSVCECTRSPRSMFRSPWDTASRSHATTPSSSSTAAILASIRNFSICVYAKLETDGRNLTDLPRYFTLGAAAH
jgi:hypothetical protein